MKINATVKKILKPALIVVVALLLLATGFWARGYYDDSQQKAATKAGQAFVADVVAGKLADAYKLTSTSLQTKQSQADFEKALSILKSDKATVQGVITTENKGTFYFSQSVQNLPENATGSTTGNFLLTITKDGNSWKVDSATVN
jgi:hypothetical protein